MWIQETIIEWINPFTKKFYISLLFKFNSNYKAIQSRIEKVFDKYEDEIKNLYLNYFNKHKKESSEFKKLFKSDILEWDLEKNIENMSEDILENPIFWSIIKVYLLQNEDFKKLSKNIDNNLSSFREIFDSQIWIYLKWWEININLLEKEKEQAVIFLWEWMKELEMIILNQVLKLITDITPSIMLNPMITSDQIKKTNKNLNKLLKDVKNKKNHEFYNELINIIDRAFDDIIWIIKI